ncbi:MFS transporter [Actinoallomurus bryophytorum]|uniref:MFS transporter n=1 Tax=Actinoallomurus bryophytorum TaxID=1490222 RepID=A0A543CQ08_9ACTN|nr:MFS transporter [Actinoallomurus bryophytorum]
MPAIGSRVFLSGQAVSLLGDGLAVLAIPLLVLGLTHSPLLTALASAPRTIGYLLVGLPSGPIVDRTDPWLLLVAMDIVRAAIFVALFLLSLTHVRSVAVILVLATAAAGAGVFFESALTVAVRDVFTGPDLIRANSFLEMAGQTSVVIGPAVVGVLAAGLGVGAGLLVVATAAIAWAVALRRLAHGLPVGGVDVRAGPDGHVEHDGLGEGRMHAVDLLGRGALGPEVVAGGGDDDRGEGE